MHTATNIQPNASDKAWLKEPDAGYEWVQRPSTNNFVSGDGNERRIHLTFFRPIEHDETKPLAVRAKAWFGDLCQGPPGNAHGGSIASILDEAMGAAAWLIGTPSVAAQLTINYHGMVPLGTRLRVKTHLHKQEGRKLWLAGELCADGSNAVLCSGESLFITVGREHFGPLMQHAEKLRRR